MKCFSVTVTELCSCSSPPPPPLLFSPLLTFLPDLWREIARSNVMDHAHLRGTVHLWGGQWLPLHVVAVSLCSPTGLLSICSYLSLFGCGAFLVFFWLFHRFNSSGMMSLDGYTPDGMLPTYFLVKTPQKAGGKTWKVILLSLSKLFFFFFLILPVYPSHYSPRLPIGVRDVSPPLSNSSVAAVLNLTLVKACRSQIFSSGKSL